MSNATEVEFKVTTDLTELSNGGIEANFEAVRAWLDENLAPYRTMAVTGDNIRDARSYRAAVRNVKDGIDQSRKAVKKAAMAPYAQFEARCKELTGLCDEAAAALDGQIKAIEDAERAAKLDGLRRVYEAEATAEEREYQPWEIIIRKEWGNKTYPVADAERDVRTAVKSVREALDIIRNLGGDDTAYLLSYYAETHNLKAALDKRDALVRAREAERRWKAKMAALRPADDSRSYDAPEESEKAPQAAENVVEAATTEVTEADKAGAPAAAETVTVCFEVICTKDKLTALGRYMRENGIRYRRPTDAGA